MDQAVIAGYRGAGLGQPRAIVHVSSPYRVASVGAIAARLGPLVTTETQRTARDLIHDAVAAGRRQPVAKRGGATDRTESRLATPQI